MSTQTEPASATHRRTDAAPPPPTTAPPPATPPTPAAALPPASAPPPPAAALLSDRSSSPAAQVSPADFARMADELADLKQLVIALAAAVPAAQADSAAAAPAPPETPAYSRESATTATAPTATAPSATAPPAPTESTATARTAAPTTAAAAHPATPPHRSGRPHWSRRALLLGGAAAAVGGAASLASAAPAAATTGAMQFGTSNDAGSATTTLRSTASNYTLWGWNNGSGAALYGHADGTGPGVRAYSDQGPAVILATSHSALPTTGSFERGSLMTLTNGELWYCAVAGTPGQWRLISSPNSAGAFVPIAPARVHDSRYNPIVIHRPPPLPDLYLALPLGSGGSRVVSVAKSYSPGTNTVAIDNVVPAGARAVAVNLTVTSPTAGGYMFLAPGDTASVSASSINWTSAGATIANGLIVGLDDSRQLKAFAQISGGSGSAHFMVDITGYFLGA